MKRKKEIIRKNGNEEIRVVEGVSRTLYIEFTVVKVEDTDGQGYDVEKSLLTESMFVGCCKLNTESKP